MSTRTTLPQDIDDAQPSAMAQPDMHTPQVDGHHQVDGHQRIAQRAYERYQTRGGEPGRDQEDWFEASAS